MKANILTPLMLWKKFSLESEAIMYSVSNKQKSDAVVEHFYINGRVTATDVVRIYGVSVVPNSSPDAPVIIAFTDGSEESEEKIALDIAKDGYRAFVINLYGKKTNKERFTVYPDDIEYANYEVAKENLYSVDKSVVKTCWYEWSVAGKYAFSAIKNKVGDAKIGVVGVKDFANVVWQLAAFEKDVACAVSLFGFGWDAYRKIHKLGDKLEPHFDDETLMFVAGIESESYALHVKCPTLVLTATNSDKWSVDRAHDTTSKIKDEVFNAVDYSVGYTDTLSSGAKQNLRTFFKSYLTEKDGYIGRAKADIKAEINQGKIEVVVTPEDDGVKEVILYSAEEIANPAKRCWIKLTDYKFDNGDYIFSYLPYPSSKTAFFFAKVVLENGFTYSTVIIPKKFTEKEIGVSHKSTVVFSGRIQNGESVFAPIKTAGLFADEKEEVLVKNGPMGISGVGSQNGLLTFKVGGVKDNPKDDAIFMMDAFSKEENTVSVSLIDSDGVTYTASQKINGGKVWFNLKFEKQKFKTVEGRILRSYEKIIKIQIESIEACLINNALWV